MCATGSRRRRWAPPRCWPRNSPQYGAGDIRERSHDVKFQGTLEVGYRACLWSRTATRVLLSVGSIEASSASSIFEAVKRIDWRDHLAPGATLACDCSGGNESHPPHDLRLAAAQGCGVRQSARVHRRAPEHRARAPGRAAAPARRRGPRRWCRWTSPARVCTGAAIAPRAAVRRSRRTWRRRCCCAPAGRASATEGGPLVDPMCGSGTFLTEAALDRGRCRTGARAGVFRLPGLART